jgi:hypothetical protein
LTATGAYRVFSEIVLQIGGVELLQRAVNISGAVYIEPVAGNGYAGEALAVLGVHVLLK